MIDKLIEGKLLTLIVGSVFRLVEILVRALHITVRGLRLLVQALLTSRVDPWISAFGKRMLAARTAVDESSIVFIERDGEYTGDPKYLAEELLRRRSRVTITWVLRDQSIGPFPRDFRFVKYGSADFFRAVARAKVVVQNSRSLQECGAVKGPSQHWVQTGQYPAEPADRHTARGLRPAGPLRRRIPDAEFDVLLARGHARNDILVDTSRETTHALRKKVLDRLDITDVGQKFLLYSPARGLTTDTAPLSGIDIAGVRAAMSAKFGGTWEVLVHGDTMSTAESEASLAGFPAYCRNASSYPDLQELLVLADAGMTDCSGWAADYLLTKKPAFLFTTQRPGTRLGRTALPLTVATSNRELLDTIARFEHAFHEAEIEQYLARCSSADDGRAASRIVDEIEELMGR